MEQALTSLAPVAAAIAHAVRAKHQDRLTMADVILVVSTTMKAARDLQHLTNDDRRVVVLSSVQQAVTEVFTDIVPDARALMAEIADVVEALYALHTKVYKHSRRFPSCV